MNAVTKVTPIQAICQTIDNQTNTYAESLKGTGISPQRFAVTAKTAIQLHQQKDKLAEADRNSLFLAIRSAAAKGLMPDGVEGALVIYGSQVQFLPMVQGLVKLARQSGEIENIGAFVVYDKDHFKYRAGIDAIPEHEADWFDDRGNPIGVWAFVKLKSGDYMMSLLPKERIDRIKSRSKMPGNYDVKNGKDWDEFWKKAAIRNVLKFAPKSSALENAMDDGEFDDSYSGQSPEPQPTHPDVTSIPTPDAKPTRAAVAVKAKAKPEPAPHDVDGVVDADYIEREPGYDEEDGVPV